MWNSNLYSLVSSSQIILSYSWMLWIVFLCQLPLSLPNRNQWMSILSLLSSGLIIHWTRLTTIHLSIVFLSNRIGWTIRYIISLHICSRSRITIIFLPFPLWLTNWIVSTTRSIHHLWRIHIWSRINITLFLLISTMLIPYFITGIIILSIRLIWTRSNIMECFFLLNQPSPYWLTIRSIYIITNIIWTNTRIIIISIYLSLFSEWYTFLCLNSMTL